MRQWIDYPNICRLLFSSSTSLWSINWCSSTLTSSKYWESKRLHLKGCDVVAGEEKLSSPLQGHTDELWGLAVHPWKPQFLTCGYDRQVCLWDSSSHQLIWTKSMEVSLSQHCPLGSVMGITYDTTDDESAIISSDVLEKQQKLHI